MSTNFDDEKEAGVGSTNGYELNVETGSSPALEEKISDKKIGDTVFKPYPTESSGASYGIQFRPPEGSTDDLLDQAVRFYGSEGLSFAVDLKASRFVQDLERVKARPQQGAGGMVDFSAAPLASASQDADVLDEVQIRAAWNRFMAPFSTAWYERSDPHRAGVFLNDPRVLTVLSKAGLLDANGARPPRTVAEMKKLVALMNENFNNFDEDYRNALQMLHDAGRYVRGGGLGRDPLNVRNERALNVLSPVTAIPTIFVRGLVAAFNAVFKSGPVDVTPLPVITESKRRKTFEKQVASVVVGHLEQTSARYEKEYQDYERHWEGVFKPFRPSDKKTLVEDKEELDAKSVKEEQKPLEKLEKDVTTMIQNLDAITSSPAFVFTAEDKAALRGELIRFQKELEVLKDKKSAETTFSEIENAWQESQKKFFEIAKNAFTGRAMQESVALYRSAQPGQMPVQVLYKDLPNGRQVVTVIGGPMKAHEDARQDLIDRYNGSDDQHCITFTRSGLPPVGIPVGEGGEPSKSVLIEKRIFLKLVDDPNGQGKKIIQFFDAEDKKAEHPLKNYQIPEHVRTRIVTEFNEKLAERCGVQCVVAPPKALSAEAPTPAKHKSPGSGSP